MASGECSPNEQESLSANDAYPLNRVIYALYIALGGMTHHAKLKLRLHQVALFAEAVGTLFIYLDVVRTHAQLRAAGRVSYEGGPPPGYQSWIHDSAGLGFALLFAGMLLAAVVLYLEHRAIVAAAASPQPPTQSPRPSAPEAPPP